MTLVMVAVGGCKNDWRTDMWVQPSHRPQSMPRSEPEHAVPLGAAPPLVDIDDTEDFRNPVSPDVASVAHGRRIFVDRCACCHGPAGHGGGPVSKYFPPAPDLAYTTIRARSDGRLFGSITLGGRAMPPQAEGLTTSDRWDVVNFVRVLQRGGSGAPP